MTDKFSKTERSKIMSKIKGRDTAPEKTVAKILRNMEYRFRLHDDSLPGCPDFVLTRKKKIIFVNGCFWHGHKNCSRATRPKTNRRFWIDKIDKNVKRDAKNRRQLRAMGWKTLVVWQCKIRHKSGLEKRLEKFVKGW